MDDALVLSRLAAAAGLETRYRDAWGTTRTVDDDAVRALLGALGLPVHSAREAEERLHELDEARWGSLLDPVVVLPAEAGTALLVVKADAEELGEVLEWRLTLESGDTQTGRIALADTGAEGAAEIDGRRKLRRTLVLPMPPMGYHRIAARLGRRRGEMAVIVAPQACYLPPELEDGSRVWGLATQLHGLRSRRNWGIGDFGDLATLATGMAELGARTIGVNPLHALFSAEPRHISPYSPSSRLFINDLYIDVPSVPEFATCPAAQQLVSVPPGSERLAKARDSAYIDHPAVAGLKRLAFAALYREFRARHLGSEPEGARTGRGTEFRRFQRTLGDALRKFAIFETLHETQLAAGAGFAWDQWELALQDPSSREVAAFAAARLDRIEYFEYVQWLADTQLAAAPSDARAGGLSIGLYRDLAVGVDPNGADAWADQELLVPGATIGAPPDLLNLKGQNWGLAPISPLALQRRAYAPFVAGLRANMRHAGALRIDHVMGLQRLYWVPRGLPATQGAYVNYPFEDLVRILALESHRHRCAAIGEDLGTVPEGFRERMRAGNVLSYRVLVFERQPDGSFIPPGQYPELAAASVGTHDLATLRGFWSGRDIDWRERLDLYPDAATRSGDRENRARERHLLVDALVREGVLPHDGAAALLGPEDTEVTRTRLREAVHRYLARSNARLVLVQIEDAVDELEQVNLPGTVDEHPNWRRKLSLSVEELLADPAVRHLLAAVNEERRQPRRAGPG